MANIRDLLEKIKTAIRGKEVRGAIHDSIEQCYEDASESLTKSTEALELATEISERMDDIGDVRSLIAKVENTSTAAYMHLAGEYIIFNNAIYQTRAIIYPGDTITPGTNIGSLPYDGGMAKALSLAVEPLQFTVRYNGLQTISDSEKRFARKNIDAVGSSDLDEVSRFVANGSETIDLSDYEQSVTPSSFNGVLPFTISPSGTVVTLGTTSYKSYQIERKTGRTVLKITANSNKTAMVTFVKEPLPNTLTNGTDVSSYICSDSEIQYAIQAGTTEHIPIPSDCDYFIIRRNFGSSSPEWAPDGVSITTGIDERVSALEPAASSEDVGKFLKVKTVSDGKVTEYEFGDGGDTITPATQALIKDGTDESSPIMASGADAAAFYGLAKAAGADMKNVSGTSMSSYPSAQLVAIERLIGLSSIVGTVETQYASKQYTVGKAFLYNGKLYKATTLISAGTQIKPGTNCSTTTLINLIQGA